MLHIYCIFRATLLSQWLGVKFTSINRIIGIPFHEYFDFIDGCGIDKHLRTIIIDIKTDSAIVWCFCTFYNNYLAKINTWHSWTLTPKCCRNTCTRLVCYLDGSLVTEFTSWFYLNLILALVVYNDPNDFDHGIGLLNILQLLNWCETKYLTWFYSGFSIRFLQLFNFSITIKCDLKIILDGGKSFVGHLDLASTHPIHIAFWKSIKVFASTIIKEGCLYLTITSINKITRKKFSLASCIIPAFHWILFRQTYFYWPVMRECIQAWNRNISCIIVTWKWYPLEGITQSLSYLGILVDVVNFRFSICFSRSMMWYSILHQIFGLTCYIRLIWFKRITGSVTQLLTWFDWTFICSFFDGTLQINFAANIERAFPSFLQWNCQVVSLSPLEEVLVESTNFIKVNWTTDMTFETSINYIEYWL